MIEGAVFNQRILAVHQIKLGGSYVICFVFTLPVGISIKGKILCLIHKVHIRKLHINIFRALAVICEIELCKAAVHFVGDISVACSTIVLNSFVCLPTVIAQAATFGAPLNGELFPIRKCAIERILRGFHTLDKGIKVDDLRFQNNFSRNRDGDIFALSIVLFVVPQATAAVGANTKTSDLVCGRLIH